MHSFPRAGAVWDKSLFDMLVSIIESHPFYVVPRSRVFVASREQPICTVCTICTISTYEKYETFRNYKTKQDNKMTLIEQVATKLKAKKGDLMAFYEEDGRIYIEKA